MAYDDGMAEAMRVDIGDMPGLSEKKMIGGRPSLSLKYS